MSEIDQLQVIKFSKTIKEKFMLEKKRYEEAKGYERNSRFRKLKALENALDKIGVGVPCVSE